jgi:hypothetical protein
MAKVQERQSLNVSAERVWQLIGGFNTLPEWHPAVHASTLEDGGRMAGGGLTERLLTFNEVERQYSYRIEQGPLPVTGYRAVLTVQGPAASNGSVGGCRVEWSSEFAASGVSDAEAEALVLSIFRAGLDFLRQRFGGDLA